MISSVVPASRVHGVAGGKTSRSVLTEEASGLEESCSEVWTRARRSRAACCRGAMLKGPAGGSAMNPASGKQSQVRGHPSLCAPYFFSVVCISFLPLL